MDWRKSTLILVIVSIMVGVLMALAIMIGVIIHNHPSTARHVRDEELAFWGQIDTLSLEDRSALINYMERTGEIPRVLPWWEYDNDMCSATVVKYIVLLTGVKLVHAPAWQLREHRACQDCVRNSRKLVTMWDATNRFDKYGTPNDKAALIADAQRFNFDPDQIYVIGFLWEETGWWDTIKAQGPDINSHVGLVIHGRVLHFIHYDHSGDPLQFESIDEIWDRGKLLPVWIARVQRKSGYDKRHRLSNAPLRLPRVSYELAFDQEVMPYEVLRHALIFPRRHKLLPKQLEPLLEQADGVLEKALFAYVRNGYDMYPTEFRRVQP